MRSYYRVSLTAFSFVLGLIMISGCMNNVDEPLADTKKKSKTELASAYSTKLIEDRSVYSEDEADDLVRLYMTIPEHNLSSEQPLSWNQFNSISRVDQNTDDNALEVILQEGMEKGPVSGMFGYSENHANGVITIRGKSTIRAAQKSYKIKMYDKAGLWKDQKTINLIKHAYDSTRMRNKLSFDYFKLIPDFTSLRTQFVHLYVKDLTGGDDATFVDYGLYTQIEQPNKSFLRSHGLDSNGQLYKAAKFEFFRYADALKTVDDPTYDEAKFEAILESKGSNDHEKLLRMLDDLNNYSLTIDDIFEKHFDRDNFLTWMSVNILMDNFDTINQNFMLYSPLNSNKWFFLPWDYDGGWGDTEFDEESSKRRPEWQRGISNYWGNILQNRFFKNPDNVQQLHDKMEELKTIININQTSEFIDEYEPVVSPFVHRSPDLNELPRPVSEFEQELEDMKQLTEIAERKFVEGLEKPMPFFLADVEQEMDTIKFNWGASYDLQGDDLIYHYQLAKNPNFTNAIKDLSLAGVSISVDDLAKGKYFWKVTVQDSKGNESMAFDKYVDIEGERYLGVREFYVE